MKNKTTSCFFFLAFVAGVTGFLLPTNVNYDTMYHLLWGRDIQNGRLPGFMTAQAPTPHPLYIGITTFLSFFGNDAKKILIAFCLGSFILLSWTVFRLTCAVFQQKSAYLAAFFTISSIPLITFSLRGFVDIPFLLFIFLAAAIAAEEHRDKTSTKKVFFVLVFAGLLRPEAWALSGLYWLWSNQNSGQKENLQRLILVVAAPAIWVATDTLVTGQPFFSLTATSELASFLKRPHPHGLAAVTSFLHLFGAYGRIPIIGLAVIGIIWACKTYRLNELVIPLGILGCGLAGSAFLASGAFGLFLQPRYLLIPATALNVFAGFAVIQLVYFRPTSAHFGKAWVVALAFSLVGSIIFFTSKVSNLHRLSAAMQLENNVRKDLFKVLDHHSVKAFRHCGPISFPSYRLVPDTRWHYDLKSSEVFSRGERRAQTGVAIFLITEQTLRRFAFADGVTALTNVPPTGFTPVARYGSVAAYGRCLKTSYKKK